MPTDIRPSPSFSEKSLKQQGYNTLSATQLKQLDWGLRFTPTACSLMTLYGIATHSAVLLWAVGLLGIWAFLKPAAHPMDLLYNRYVRHWFHAMALPPNPLPRRLACLAAGVMNLLAAGLFTMDLAAAAVAVGAVLLVFQLIVITTHFCVLSWFYALLPGKAAGASCEPLSGVDPKTLISRGAILVDVRSPQEFARGSLAGAINVPLDVIDHNIDKLRDSPCMVFCASGIRSRMASQKLRQQGVREVYDLGALGAARAQLA